MIYRLFKLKSIKLYFVLSRVLKRFDCDVHSKEFSFEDFGKSSETQNLGLEHLELMTTNLYRVESGIGRICDCLMVAEKKEKINYVKK
jgi:hypothetical protein